jgi:hypothetical protein
VPNHGQLSVELNSVTVGSGLLTSLSASGSSTLWIVGQLAAARYHIRFNFKPATGTGISSLTLHSGQPASSPVLVSCPVTNSVADVLLSWPGGPTSMLAVIGGSLWSYFSSITIVPTATRM